MSNREEKALTEKQQKQLQEFLEAAPPEILEILDNLDSQDAAEKTRITRQISRSFSGPLPPPEMLRGYEDIEPGFANRIVAMAEKEQAHRQNSETKALRASVSAETRGQYLAFVLCALVIGGSVYLIGIGTLLASISGLVIATGGLSGLAYVFIAGRKRRQSAAKTDRSSQEE